MQTILGLFDNHESVKAVYDDLLQEGLNPRDIEVLRRNNTDELNHLKSSMDDPDVDFYLESVNQGGTLVSVDTPDDKARRVAEILTRHGMIDVDRHAQTLRSQGSNVQLRNYNDNDQVLQVVEESLAVGKREVERGRVRVYNRITERAVEEQIGLRDETINVERRTVNRPLSGAELDAAFQERSFEMTEVDEEAVVAKTARVVEEVVISKEVANKVETIRDTVRRSDVQVEEDYQTARQYSDYDTDFRSYYDRDLANTGMTYEQYSPAFRYGHQLADHYPGRSWTDIESDAHQMWEDRNPNTWDKFRAIIRHSFERVNAK
ncbi:hypothetical protein C7H19_00885 [Aphanothece hegewaldii CCALA 016]|uniref:DUF2382 domain-containing protein n=1 Tax=Aphanothece hegewaldii CCALA 016 TaxID=2107694 RepID=A0A2T1M3F6_9CHRO|nr:YsnF/AvaK domain-containing protein [Aphanothece hegewaldii]PSF39374.1 hypothetical protein C7H19_00885 [Aphanothece hegewaldii CCALA 016]